MTAAREAWLGRLGGLCFCLLVLSSLAPGPSPTQEDHRAQKRPSRVRVPVPVNRVTVDDGDTFHVDWEGDDRETVRVLGIDAPEIQHVPHGIPYDQPFGREASGFAKGALATAIQVELLRADRLDAYGRTLAYVFINGRNYSELIVRARLAVESVSHYGDQGFPVEAKAVLDAAKATGPVPFEPPYVFRQRMREVTEWRREKGE